MEESVAHTGEQVKSELKQLMKVQPCALKKIGEQLVLTTKNRGTECKNGESGFLNSMASSCLGPNI